MTLSNNGDNLALLFEPEISKMLESYSNQIKTLRPAEYTLGNNSFPHSIAFKIIFLGRAAWKQSHDLPAFPIDPFLITAQNIEVNIALGISGHAFQFVERLY
jgi:hypothetical protein